MIIINEKLVGIEIIVTLILGVFGASLYLMHKSITEYNEVVPLVRSAYDFKVASLGYKLSLIDAEVSSDLPIKDLTEYIDACNKYIYSMSLNGYKYSETEDTYFIYSILKDIHLTSIKYNADEDGELLKFVHIDLVEKLEPYLTKYIDNISAKETRSYNETVVYITTLSTILILLVLRIIYITKRLKSKDTYSFIRGDMRKTKRD